MTLFGVVYPGGTVVPVWADGYRRGGDTLTFWRYHDPSGDVWQHDVATCRGPWIVVLDTLSETPCSPSQPSPSPCSPPACWAACTGGWIS